MSRTERLDFGGRVVLVTGAGRGIGRAYALWFAAHGASVVVNNRRHAGVPSAAEAVAAEIRANGGSAIPDEHSIDTAEGNAAMVRTALDAFDRVDALVCNASINPTVRLPVQEIPMEEARRMMDINFWGTFHGIRAALPAMLDAGYGRIVVTTSAAGLYGQANLSIYAASKMALIGLMRGVQCETRPADIRINAISPYARTQMSEKAIPADHAELMSPARIAWVVGYLCSEACKRGGAILAAGAGRLRRTMIVEGAIVEPVDEDLTGLWPTLDDLHGVTEPRYVFDATKTMVPELMAPK
ncbi:SDR family NAD(P)-dependent oxidoreductase [Sphingobium sp.]|uniref:SDR family NAD(P)-dependent oxidoreductase n=1 Tax=Sphingobium sp. TaxID=1912891 RepID=UPI0028BDCACB|nr:SDR family NAD(P)-dependent oxidoreductase [Sphingobium sp.]